LNIADVYIPLCGGRWFCCITYGRNIYCSFCYFVTFNLNLIPHLIGLGIALHSGIPVDEEAVEVAEVEDVEAKLVLALT